MPNGKILNASADIGLLKTRAMVLESAGYAVTSVSNWAEFEAACAGATHDLLILGQSLPPSLKHDMEEFSKKHCIATKIVEFYILAPSTPTRYHFHAGASLKRC